ncbi:MAG: protein-L-isoaspartate(D-aspartate) O-methyltransferase [Melioribacteraceae bacterium]|nr:protein-L-isoaspartate(D-aspartate) O-methyltransferase [Melioribacteraceae bacterium]
MIKYIIIFCLPLLLFSQDKFKLLRYDMVDDQIVSRGIRDEKVLDAFREVKRHEFVFQSYIDFAYQDRPLPIGYGQTISQPYIVAYMTQIIEPDSDDRILEIGTGSGYQAAILSKIVKEVYSIEIISELSASAESKLNNADFSNVQLKTADGYYGWEEYAPFDAIVVTAAAEYIPPPLIEQLKDGGKMIIPVGSPYLIQQLMLIEKINGEIKTKSLMPVRFVPFTRKN